MGLKVFKPLLAGLMCRTYHRQGPRFAVTGLLGFSLEDPDTPLTEQELWQSLAPFLPKDGTFDEGIPKDRGEFLVVGSCHAPEGRPVTSRRVSVRVGAMAKTLEVFGDRIWVRDRGFLAEKASPHPSSSCRWTGRMPSEGQDTAQILKGSEKAKPFRKSKGKDR